MSLEYNAENINIARAGAAIAGAAAGAAIGAGFGLLIGGPFAPATMGVCAGVGAILGAFFSVHGFNSYLENEHKGIMSFWKYVIDEIGGSSIGAAIGAEGFGVQSCFWAGIGFKGVATSMIGWAAGYCVLGGVAVAAVSTAIGTAIGMGFSFFTNAQERQPKELEAVREQTWFNGI